MMLRNTALPCPNGTTSPSPGLAQLGQPWGRPPSHTGAECRQIVAHSVSCGSVGSLELKPRRGGRILGLHFESAALLSPLWGSSLCLSQPTVHAVGYFLTVLRTSSRLAFGTSAHLGGLSTPIPLATPCLAPIPNC